MNERSIFIAALEKDDPPARAAYLDEACGADAALRQRVEKLLRSHAEAGGILDQPPVAPVDQPDAVIHQAATVAQQPSAESVGTRIGRYKLLQQIGEGGMGTVWMAEQTEPVRRMVALKIIKLGMDSSQVIARFEAERQALAIMDHPNIAKVLDAGTIQSSPLAPREESGSGSAAVSQGRPPLAEREGYTGRPYFVMELVKGTPITQYCDQHRLPLRERLELFVSVCHALQHAHQKAIIHRDIKPSNVLVAPYDGRPVVKVIDFGVAKAMGQRLTERTMFTEFGAIVGTLQYMSPEQAELNNQDIDTRSDIYSLGVLLYELLTGSTPLDMNRLRGAALAAVLMAINEEEPPKPSTRLSESKDSLPSIAAQRQSEPEKLPKLVRGELDWIVMKALDKDRMRRYETASALARDIELYLHDEPVTACPPSVAYMLRKFARKHRTVLTTAAAFAILLVGAAVVSTWQAVRATRAETIAREAYVAEAQSRQKEADAREQAEQAARAEAAARHKAERATEAESAARQSADLDRQRAVAAEKRAEADRDAAQRARDQEAAARRDAEASREQVQDSLARNLYEQARAVRLAAQPGRRWQALDLLKRSESLRSRERTPLAQPAAEPGRPDRELPTKMELRSEAIASLLINDGRVIHEWTTLGHAVSPDGKVAAVQSLDFDRRTPGTRLVDLSNGKPLAEWTGQAAGAIGPIVALGPEGKLMARGSASNLAEITIVELPSGKRVRVLKQPEVEKLGEARAGQRPFRLQNAVFSPDGNYLAGVDFWPGDTRVILWDLKQDQAEGQIIATVKQAIMTASFSPGSQLLAWAGDTKVVLWNLAEARVQQEITFELMPTGSLGFSPDGKQLAVLCIPKSPEDKSIAAPSFENLRSFVVLCDLADGREVGRIDAGKVMSHAPLAYSPDGQRLALGDMNGLVHVFDSKGESPAVVLDHQSMVLQLAWDHSGRRLMSGSPGALRVWEFAEDIPLTAHAMDKKLQPFGQFAFSADGRWAAMKTGLDYITLFDRTTNTPVRTLKVVTPGFENTLHFSTDSRLLFSLSRSGLVSWNTETGEERFQVTGTQLKARELRSIGFWPDGRILVAGGSGQGPAVWNAQTGEVLWQATVDPTNPFQIAAVSRDGRRAVVYPSMAFPGRAAQKAIMPVLDVSEQRELFRLERSIDNSGSSPLPVDFRVEFSPDGRWIASLAERGRSPSGIHTTITVMGSEKWTIAVWDAATGKEQLQLSGTSAVHTHAFSPDGQYLALALRDGTAQVWAVDKGEHLFDWRAWPPLAQGPIVAGPMTSFDLAFTPDGKSLAIDAADHSGLNFLNLSQLNSQLEQLGLGW